MNKTFMRSYYPNDTTNEQEVSSRSLPDKAPDMAYALTFYDQRQITAPDGEICRGEEKNISPVTFIDCAKFTIEQLRELISCMEENCWDKVAISRFGGVYPCDADDRFVVHEELEELY